VLRLWFPPTSTYQEVLAWVHLPLESTPATVTAVVLGLAGTLSYALLGLRGRR
jgi:hypothetical protein